MTTEYFDEMAANVASGIEYLDALSPDWADEIELSNLDLESLNYCIVGQLRGVVVPSHQTYDPELGFDVPTEVSHVHDIKADVRVWDRAMAELQQLWEAEILSRRLGSSEVAVD